MKRIVKTREELLADPLVYRDARARRFLWHKEYPRVFTPGMLEYSGKELKGDPDEDGDIKLDGYLFNTWMWKEIEEYTHYITLAPEGPSSVLANLGLSGVGKPLPTQLKAWEYVNQPSKDYEENVKKIRKEYSF